MRWRYIRGLDRLFEAGFRRGGEYREILGSKIWVYWDKFSELVLTGKYLLRVARRINRIKLETDIFVA